MPGCLICTDKQKESYEMEGLSRTKDFFVPPALAAAKMGRRVERHVVVTDHLVVPHPVVQSTEYKVLPSPGPQNSLS